MTERLTVLSDEDTYSSSGDSLVIIIPAEPEISTDIADPDGDGYIGDLIEGIMNRRVEGVALSIDKLVDLYERAKDDPKYRDVLRDAVVYP